MVNDQISDTLTRIRNASQAKHHIVAVSCTKIVEAIVKILKSEGFIDNYEIVVNTCRSCHEYLCPGPLEMINSLDLN